MFTSALRAAMYVVLATGVVSACVTTKDRTGTFIKTEEKDGRVVTSSASYEGISPLRILFKDSRESEEYVLYRGPNGQAEILFAETAPMKAHQTVLDFDKLISDSVQMWRFNQQQDLAFGQSISIDTSIGNTWVQPFVQRKSGRQCVGFSATWDKRPDDKQYRPSKIIFGYHCAPGGQTLSDEDGVSFVKSIDIRGITVRRKNVTAYDLQKSPQAEPARDQQVANLVMAQDGIGGGVAGLPDFPMLIARSFTDFDGPCTGC